MIASASEGGAPGRSSGPAVRWLDGAASMLAGAAAVGASLCLLAMVAIVAYHIFSRYVLAESPAWANELAQVLTIYFSLLGAAYAYRCDLHIGMRLVRDRFTGRARRVHELGLDVAVGAFGLAMVWWGGELVGRMTGQTLPGTGLAVAWQYLPLPICGGLLAVFSIEKMAVGHRSTTSDLEATA
jgi:TRAP-type C4-dicarboxylate transport system permease small subunit